MRNFPSLNPFSFFDLQFFFFFFFFYQRLFQLTPLKILKRKFKTKRGSLLINNVLFLQGNNWRILSLWMIIIFNLGFYLLFIHLFIYLFIYLFVYLFVYGDYNYNYMIIFFLTTLLQFHSPFNSPIERWLFH